MRLRELAQRVVSVLLIALLSTPALAATKYGKHPILVPKPPMGAWKTDFTRGIDTLRDGQRPTLLMVSISSDPACREAKEMIADGGVQQAISKWNLLYDDTDCYARYEKVLWYRTVPFFIMFDKDGREISRCGAGMTAAEFKAWIDQIYACQAAVEEAEARLKTNPNDVAALRRKSDALIYMAGKMYNADIRFAVTMPERMGRAIDACKQTVAAGDTSRELKNIIEIAEAIVQVLRGQLDPASKRLDALAKDRGSNIFEDAEFWQTYVKMVRNDSNPIRTHDPESDRLYEDFVKKYPKSFYADTARRRVEYVNAEIESEKADK